MGLIDVRLGDCLETMAAMPAESVDAIVTDPPYGLGFMGRAWDELPPGVEWAEACLRVLKPGGHLLAFGGTRTFHRLTCAIEDAGFEIRDCLSWLYGSGFPKSLDVSKAIDKAAWADREVVGRYESPEGTTGRNSRDDDYGFGMGDMDKRLLTAPATPEAAEWEGWGTALKPAWEPIIVGRKPLTGTVAANVLTYGTGALNIDGCRVGWASETERAEVNARTAPNGVRHDPGESSGVTGWGAGRVRSKDDITSPAGRWPANLVLDEQAAEMLDAEVGDRPSGSRPAGEFSSGGPSRFFYTAKASRSDRGAGNTHPTVKPTKLMRWLVRLVTPPGGVVLDPFAGSGSTLVAAQREGFRAIGIEREPEYLEIILSRIAEDVQMSLDAA